MSAMPQATMSAAAADGGGIADPARQPSAAAESRLVEELIVQVLHRAHHNARASAAADEARTVLRLAHLFADELAAINGRFDRLRFIHAVTAERG